MDKTLLALLVAKWLVEQLQQAVSEKEITQADMDAAELKAQTAFENWKKEIAL